MKWAAAILLVLSVGAGAAQAQLVPNTLGACAPTQVKTVGTRLEQKGQPVPGSGSQIVYTNGIGQVSYETIPPIEASQPGDSIMLCLESIPPNCPPNDTRGRIYKATNLRTHGSWTLPDSEHVCGGA